MSRLSLESPRQFRLMLSSTVMQGTPDTGNQTAESKSVDSMGQPQQAQAQPASWSAIAAQGAAKGSGSPHAAAGTSGRSHSSGLQSNRGSASDLRQEQVRATFDESGKKTGA